MAYPECIIPPSVKPESPYEPQLIDDQTTLFSPRFGRGTTQRQLWGDPLWGWKLRYSGLSGADRALVRAAILDARGKGANIRVTPGQPLRGSFPATEILTNNDFSNSTTGWTTGNAVLSVADRTARIKYDGGSGSQPLIYQAAAGTQYAPYAIRSFISDGANSSGISLGVSLTRGTSSATNYTTSRGLLTASAVLDSGASQNQFPVAFSSSSGYVAGTYVDCRWASYARCFLVDDGPNLLLQSDELDTTWSVTRATIDDQAIIAPDASGNADIILEDASAATTHYIAQDATVSSAVADYEFSCYLKAGTRSWAALQITESTSNHELRAFINLGSGALGTVSVSGANWTNARAFAVAAGNGWYRLHVIGRKASAATTLTAVIIIAEADSDITFSGTPANSIYAWRASLAQSSVPTRGAQTTTTALASGSAQTGSRIYVKGLPASTSGLLLTGDFVEINGELKQVTSSLDSDAAGLGVLSFRPALWRSPSDNDPVIVNNPMGRFMLANDPRIVENFGVYTDVELDLIEAGA